MGFWACGSYFEQGVIPKEEFLKAYWRVIIICWEVLGKEMINEREKQGQDYMKFFNKLYDASNDYKAREFPKVKIDLTKIKQDYNE